MFNLFGGVFLLLLLNALLFFFLTQDSLRKRVETLKLNIGWSLICSLFEIYTGRTNDMWVYDDCLSILRSSKDSLLNSYTSIGRLKEKWFDDSNLAPWAPFNYFSTRRERVCIFILRFRFFHYVALFLSHSWLLNSLSGFLKWSFAYFYFFIFAVTKVVDYCALFCCT